MGLDMYLKKAKTPKEMGGTNHYTFEELVNKYSPIRDYGSEIPQNIQEDINNDNLFEVEYYGGSKYVVGTKEVGYWQKANQIHNWFVENVQNGVDDCGYYKVSKEQLLSLMDICNKILENCKLVAGTVINGWTLNKETGTFEANFENGQIMTNSHIAEELLPTRSGFFFGGTNYDQWYYEDIKNTVEILQKASEINFDNYTLIYHSSW